MAYLWLNPNFTWHSNVRKYCCAPRRANVIEFQEDNGERPCTDTAEDCLLCSVLGCSRGWLLVTLHPYLLLFTLLSPGSNQRLDCDNGQATHPDTPGSNRVPRVRLCYSTNAKYFCSFFRGCLWTEMTWQKCWMSHTCVVHGRAHYVRSDYKAQRTLIRCHETVSQLPVSAHLVQGRACLQWDYWIRWWCSLLRKILDVYRIVESLLPKAQALREQCPELYTQP